MVEEIDEINEKKEINETKEVKEVKKQKVEKTMSPEKWARQQKLDPMIFEWWTKKGELLNEEQFKKLKRKLYGR